MFSATFPAVRPSARPTLVEPTPIEPTPIEPTPIEPTPIEPTPIEPTPIEPTLIEPTLIEPAEACAALNAGAALVDLRSAGERRHQGELPGALAPGSAPHGRLWLLLTADGSAGPIPHLGHVPETALIAGGYVGWRRQVWRQWGEFLMAEPAASASRFFRLLSLPPSVAAESA